jgi:hypothetical protein
MEAVGIPKTHFECKLPSDTAAGAYAYKFKVDDNFLGDKTKDFVKTNKGRVHTMEIE